MPAKADKLTTAQRTEAIYRLILDGWTVEQILQNSSKSWGVSDRQVYKYINAAWQRIEAVAAPQREEHLNRAIAAMYQMLREAKTIRDKAAVWRMLFDLLGLAAPKRHELGGPDGGAITHEHKGQTHGSVDHLAAVLSTLAGVGAIQLPGDAGGDAAADDELHPPPADA